MPRLMINRYGFSLIRLIVLIACIAIAAVMIFIALNPARRIRANRNARRTADVTAILQATQAYVSENATLPPDIDTDVGSVQLIGRNPGDCATIRCPGHALPAEHCAIPDLDASLQPYLGNMPADPKSGSESDTRYFINQDANHAVTVGACDAETEDLSDTTAPPIIEMTQ
ncbi:MAG: type II secretion system protein [Candidatus Peribacteraceae bacterium]|nr:type II secretion system protein [Candidatus Peribacteraceae bacterium]